LKPSFFRTPSDFRKWLERHHDTTPELWVGFHKKGSGKPSITWPESVDEALCFGWIDGVRKSIDDHSYVIRFTPRRARSIWSAVNVRRVAELTRLGRMQPAGLKAFEALDPTRTGVYSFEQPKEDLKLGSPYEAKLRANKKAWSFFRSQAPYYQRTASRWVMSAKKEETRLRRLAALIDDSARGQRIGPLRRVSPASAPRRESPRRW
jgi:uncharacterized protein YdeI (YjbR/CyaY-like superfamily)